jgi:hypothetical protein
VYVQEAKKCFEEALERATAEAEEDEKYYKLIAITIRLASVTVPYCTWYPLFKARLRIQIRILIGSGFNRVSGSRIRVQEGKNDPQK